MFFSSATLVPIVDGQLVGRDRLHTVDFTDDQGEPHKVNCMLLTVKKLSEEDYRLYGFGKGGKPLIDVPITDGDGPDSMPVALEIKDVEGEPADVVITIYGKYQARFKGGVAE